MHRDGTRGEGGKIIPVLVKGEPPMQSWCRGMEEGLQTRVRVQSWRQGVQVGKMLQGPIYRFFKVAVILGKGLPILRLSTAPYRNQSTLAEARNLIDWHWRDLRATSYNSCGERYIRASTKSDTIPVIVSRILNGNNQAVKQRKKLAGLPVNHLCRKQYAPFSRLDHDPSCNEDYSINT